MIKTDLQTGAVGVVKEFIYDESEKEQNPF